MNCASKPISRSIVTLSLALAAACDGSSGPSDVYLGGTMSSVTIGSGVSGSKGIGEMSDAEAKMVCLWTNDLLADHFTPENGALRVMVGATGLNLNPAMLPRAAPAR